MRASMSKKTIIIILGAAALMLILGWFYLIIKWWPEICPSNMNTARNETMLIFSTSTANRLSPEPKEIKIIAVGDIMLSRTVEQKMLDKNNFDYPFLKMKEYLKTADLAFGNLETAITPGRVIESGEMTFRADPKVAQILRNNNFQIVSLANNHTPNFGQKGLKDTFEYLTRAGIKYAGAGNNLEEARRAQYLKVGDINIAWLSRTEQVMVPESYAAGEIKAGTAFWDKQEIADAVKAAKEKADLVIVSMHAGVEYRPKPTEEQQAFARAAIEAGAEIVIGHHPHVVQSAEKYQGKYIFYSLGNFIFDQMWSRETREGITLEITLTKSGVNQIAVTPILIEDYCQPRMLTGEEGEKIIKRLEMETEEKGEDYILK